jgi:hypothetical protein
MFKNPQVRIFWFGCMIPFHQQITGKAPNILVKEFDFLLLCQAANCACIYVIVQSI